MLRRQIDPILESLDVLRSVEHYFFAVRSHQIVAVLQREGLKHPIGVAGHRNLQPPLAVTCQLDRIFLHLCPGCRRLLRVQSGSLELILVVIQNDGAALERNTVGFALCLGILHKSRIEVRQISVSSLLLYELVQRNNRIHIQQAEQLRGLQYRYIGRLFRLDSGLGFDRCIGIAAGVNRLNHNIGVLLHKICSHRFNGSRQRSSDSNRVIVSQLRLGSVTRRCGCGFTSPGPAAIASGVIVVCVCVVAAACQYRHSQCSRHNRYIYFTHPYNLLHYLFISSRKTGSPLRTADPLTLENIGIPW
ncbi:hypothetical protein D3C75_609190 [compost metagenome]